MLHSIVRLLCIPALLVSAASGLGCQIAYQAADVFNSRQDPNYLQQKEILPLSSLRITDQPAATQHQGEVLTLQAISSTPPTLLSVGQDGRVIGWDLTSARGYEVKDLKAQPKVVALGEQQALIAWADDNGISITCLQGCTTKKTLTALKARPLALAFHDLDTTLLIGSLDGRIYRWRFMDDQDASSTEERERMIERYIGHQTMISGVVGHSVGRAFFSSDWDGRLVGWASYTADDQRGEYDKNLFRGRFYTDIPAAVIAQRPADRGISALAISKDGERIAIGTEDGFVEVWKVKGFLLNSRKNLHTGRITSIALSDDGDRVASVGKDSKVRAQLITANPMYSAEPNALPALLEDISEHYIPLAHRAAFVSDSKLSVGTKGGEVLEVLLAEPTPKAAKPTPKSTPKVRDGDY